MFKKNSLLAVALSLLASQVSAASVTYEIQQPSVFVPAFDETLGPSAFKAELDLDAAPFTLEDAQVEFSVNIDDFEANLDVTQNGVTTRYSDINNRSTSNSFTFFQFGFWTDFGTVTLDFDSAGDVTDFSYFLFNPSTQVRGDKNGCSFFDDLDPISFTCDAPPTLLVNGAAVGAATTAAVPLPLPGLMLGAGLIGFIGLRRKKAA